MIKKRFNILMIMLFLSFSCSYVIWARSTPFEDIGKTYSTLINEYERDTKTFKGYMNEDIAKTPIQKIVYYTLNQMNDIAYYNLIRDRMFGVSRQEGESARIIDMPYLSKIVFENRPYRSPLFDISYAAFLVHLKNTFVYKKDSSADLESSILFSNVVSKFQKEVEKRVLNYAIGSLTLSRSKLAILLSSQIKNDLIKKKEKINPDILSFLRKEYNNTVIKTISRQATDIYSPFVHSYLSSISIALRGIKDKMDEELKGEIIKSALSLENSSTLSNLKDFKSAYENALSSIYMKAKLKLMKEKRGIRKLLSTNEMKGELIQTILSSYKKNIHLDWWRLRWFVYLLSFILFWILSLFIKALRGKFRYLLISLFILELVSFSTDPHVLGRGIEITLYGITVVSLLIFTILIWLKRLFSSNRKSLKEISTFSILISLSLIFTFPLYKNVKSLKLSKNTTFRRSSFYELLKDDAYRSPGSFIVNDVNHIKSLLSVEHNELYQCSFTMPLSQLNVLGKFNSLIDATLTRSKDGQRANLVVQLNTDSPYFSYDNSISYMDDIDRMLRTLKNFDISHKERMREINNTLKTMTSKVKRIYMYGDEELARETSDFILTSFSNEKMKSLYVEIFKRLLPLFSISSHSPEISFFQVEWGVKAFMLLSIMLIISILGRTSFLLRISSYTTGFIFLLWMTIARHSILRCLTLYAYPIYITNGKSIQTNWISFLILSLTLIPLIDIILDSRVYFKRVAVRSYLKKD